MTSNREWTARCCVRIVMDDSSGRNLENRLATWTRVLGSCRPPTPKGWVLQGPD